MVLFLIFVLQIKCSVAQKACVKVFNSFKIFSLLHVWCSAFILRLTTVCLCKTKQMKNYEFALSVNVFKIFILLVCIGGVYYVFNGKTFLMKQYGVLSHKLKAEPLFIAHKGVQGVDVSHYQYDINWKKVDEDGISFAFIKATEGKSMRDNYFKRNWNKIDKTSIHRGAYHFFLPAADVKKQFNNFSKNVNLSKGDLRPLLDVEKTQGLSPQLIRNRVAEWLELAEEHYGVKPIIYTTQRFYNTYFKNQFNDYSFVIARYNTKVPYLLDERKLEFWQYTDNGNVKGINVNVDRQVFKGTIEALEKYCIKNI
jgi:lysozyme